MPQSACEKCCGEREEPCGNILRGIKFVQLLYENDNFAYKDFYFVGGFIMNKTAIIYWRFKKI